MEKILVPINGLSQGMFIESRDEVNAVLLFIHGGPGMPEFWLTRRYPTGLAEIFTVAWWEQRGAGLSFSREIPPDTMTVEQFIGASDLRGECEPDAVMGRVRPAPRRCGRFAPSDAFG